MADVFISYSRKNKVFADQLFSRLEASGRDAWIDWGDIPSSAQWWQEIQEGIESSDNFLLIVSPHSLSSPVCQLEIAHARRANKRIVPLIYAQPQIEVALGRIAAIQPDNVLRDMPYRVKTASSKNRGKRICLTMDTLMSKGCSYVLVRTLSFVFISSRSHHSAPVA